MFHGTFRFCVDFKNSFKLGYVGKGLVDNRLGG
jgi:hypothetical protein